MPTDPSAPWPQWLTALERIREGCQVKGWDSYGAHPVTDNALDAAREFCSSLYVVPTNDGGINITMANEAVSIELDDLGHITAVCTDRIEAMRWLAAVTTPTCSPAMTTTRHPTATLLTQRRKQC